jgi:hypothetical protein
MAQVGGLYSALGFPAMQASSIYLREDLIDLVYNLDKQRKAAVFLAMPKTVSNGLNHEWEQDSLPATATTGAPEGEDWASAAVAARTRLANAVQTFKFNFAVTLDALEYSLKGRAPGVANEYEHQVERHLMVLEQSMDARLVALGTAVASASATSSAAVGLLAAFRAWHASASGAAGAATSNNVNEACKINIAGAWSRTRFLALHEYMFGLGADPDTLACDPGVKADITSDVLGETASAQMQSTSASSIASIPAVIRQIHTDSSNTEYTADVQFMRTDFGRVAILVDRFIPTAATATNAVMGGAFFLYERAKQRLAFWRPMRHYPLPPNGDSMRGYCHAAATLENLTPRTLGIGYNVTT